VESSVV